MSKVVFMSCNGESLPIAHRMLLEGTPTEMYVHNPKARLRNYKGILPRLDVPGLFKALKTADTVIFDLTHPNEGTPWDYELLRMVGIKTHMLGADTFTPNSVFGPVADKLRKNHKVIGCSTWSEDIELDRTKGAEIAREIGLTLPPAQEFKDLKSGLRFLESIEGTSRLWVLKPFNNQDLDLTYVESYQGELTEKFKNELPKRTNESTFHHMLQEKISGTELSTEVWFDGENLVSHNRTVEGKKFLCGNLGVQIGSQNNTVWLCDDKLGVVLRNMRGLIPHLKRAGYIGPVDANCIISGDGKANFLEWSARLGYDAIYCLLSFLPEGNISSFFLSDFKIHSTRAKFASSARITIPPFPGKDKKELRERAQGVPIVHDIKWLIKNNFWAEDIYYDRTTEILRCGGRDGVIGVQTATGDNIKDSCESVLRRCESLHVGASKQYRIDLADRPEKARSTLNRLGLSID